MERDMKPFWPVDMQYPIFQRWMENPENYTKRGGHPGIDFDTPKRSPWYASWEGDITAAAYRKAGGYGREIFLKVKWRWIVVYGHADELLVRVGDHVTRGQLIGYSGGGLDDPYRGNSKGEHTHFEVRDTSKPWDNAVDPEVWLATDLDGDTQTAPEVSTPVTSGTYMTAIDTPNVRLEPDLSDKYDIGDLKIGDKIKLLGNSKTVNGIEFVNFEAWVAKEYIK
jgi:murein DD-endopeptidase MepM/ murein hydrolase activator NlpD